MRWILALGLLAMVASGALGDPIQPRGGSLYVDRVASKPGDVLVVVIKDTTNVVQQADTQSRHDSQRSLFGIASLFSAFFPQSVDNSTTSGSHSNDNHEHKFESTLSVTVDDVLANGNLSISGQRVITLNGQRQQLTVKGEVRPEDIASDNTIPSNRIGNLRVDYKGPLKGHQRKGLMEWVLDLFN